MEKEMLNQLKFENGLISAIAQDWNSGEVLMMAYMNKEALLQTIKTKKAHYWSRSKGKLWKKGEIPGHEQIVHKILVDCDMDSILLGVEQLGGGACHTGYSSCFYRTIEGKLIRERMFDPREVYHLKQ